MTVPQQQQKSIRDKVIAGALWLTLTRWVHRLIGLVSTMVLARVLMPEDFGIVAIISAVAAIIDGFFDFGFDLALIRARDPCHEDFDTTWSLIFLKGLVFGVSVIAISPIVANFSDAPDIIAISIVIGCGIMIRGAENIGIVSFEKELQYDRLFRFRLFTRLAGSLTTISLALILKSYWAIVFGILLSNIYQTIFSYVVCTFRPHFRLQGSAKIWGFSKWILLSAISRQLYTALDRFILSGWVGKRELGFFSVTSSLAGLITTELVGAVGAALIPGYAKLQDDKERLRSAFMVSQAIFLALLIPATVGTFLLAQQITAVVLGAQWLDSAWMLGYFVLFYMTYTVVENLNRFMAMAGLQRISAHIGMLRTVIFLLLIFPSFHFGGIPMLIEMKIVLSVLEMLLLAHYCCRQIETPLHHYLRAYFRPVLSSGLMAILVVMIDAKDLGPTLVEMTICAFAGAGIYAASSFVLWHFSGRPSGLESIVLDLLIRKRLFTNR
jgi:lipopolysaccharide exporter